MFHDHLDDFKAHVISEWKGITPYLHQLLVFGDEMDASPTEEDEAAYKEFQDRTWSIAVKAMEMIQEILAANLATRETFKRRKDSFTALIPPDTNRAKIKSRPTPDSQAVILVGGMIFSFSKPRPISYSSHRSINFDKQ